MTAKRITLHLQRAEAGEFVLTCPKCPGMRFAGSTPGEAIDRFWKCWGEVQSVLAKLRQQYPDEFQLDP